MSKSKKKNTLKCEECGFETEDQDELEEHKRDSTELHKKFKTIIEKNTFFKTNVEFYRQYEVDTIDALKQKLLELHDRIKNSNSRKEELVKFIQEYDEGLECVLILLGISDEFFQRLILASRILNDPKLHK